MFLFSLAFALAAGGCGGGDVGRSPQTQSPDGGASTSAVTVSVDATHLSSARSADTAAPVQGADPSWTLCAGENAWCGFSGSHVVHYGAGTQWVAKTLVDGSACSNDIFGDPVVGIVKSCWVEPAAPTAAAAVWTSCAAENGWCTFASTTPLPVRYGANAHYATKTLASPVDCSNGNFGDPLMGVVKSCEVALPAATPAADNCESLPSLPQVPSNANVVTSFCVNGHCARPDDDDDDTDAIDAALNASEGKFLVFPPGRYLIKRSLRIKHPGVTLWGPGATIHATNNDDQSIIIESDNTSIYSFTLTAVTGQRGSRAEHTRIAIYGPSSVHPVVKNTVIQNNQIVPAGRPGTALANSATGAGIFVNAADGFVIAGNTVSRSLADGIHLTGGSRNGRVIFNTVKETGDDMIAVVSYAYPDPLQNTAATIAGNFAGSLDTYRSRNILIADNTLSGQYWGRGIAIVGGKDITVRANSLTNVPYAAAILLARETQSGTYGLDNIRVEKNIIRDEQTLNPPYDVQNTFASHSRTGHGAIEVQASMFVDELAWPQMVSGFAVGNLAIVDNTITAAASPGVRIGVGTGTRGNVGARAITGDAPLSNIRIERNAMNDIRVQPAVQLMAAGVASCSANTLDGQSLNSVAACLQTPTSPAATGYRMTCSKP